MGFILCSIFFSFDEQINAAVKVSFFQLSDTCEGETVSLLQRLSKRLFMPSFHLGVTTAIVSIQVSISCFLLDCSSSKRLLWDSDLVLANNTAFHPC